MNGKKLLAGISIFCLAFSMILSLPVHAQESGNTTVIKTTVPSSHTVLLEIGEHGSVMADGKTYTGTQTIQVERLKEETYTIQAEKGWKVTEVTYGPEGQAAQVILEDSSFTAPSVNQNGNVLTVAVEKDSADVDQDTAGTSGGKTPQNTSGGQTLQDTSGSKTDSVKTGDEINPGFFIEIMAVSILIASGCIIAARKRKE